MDLSYFPDHVSILCSFYYKKRLSNMISCGRKSDLKIEPVQTPDVGHTEVMRKLLSNPGLKSLVDLGLKSLVFNS
jgi:hypothetical protein